MATAPDWLGRAWRRVFRGGRTSRALAWAGASVLALVLLAEAVSLVAAGPGRRRMEREVNSRLTGYSVRIGKLDLQLYRLAVSLSDVAIRQQSNPDPPVAILPRLHASIEWRALLHGKLVADFLFERPQFHVDLTQAKTEAASPVRLKDRGWQGAALAIFPLKINTLRIQDGKLTYIDEDPSHPLELTHADFLAEDIRNIRSPARAYPSPVRLSAAVFESGRATVEGHADFFAEPNPGFHVRFDLRGIPLSSLQPVSHHANLSVQGGVLSGRGETELAPGVRLATLSDLEISGMTLDYVSDATPASAPAPAPAPPPAPPEQPGRDHLAMRIDRLRILRSEFGFQNRSKNPPYRVFVDQADFELDGYDGAFGKRPATAKVSGRFMGSGPASASLRIGVDHGKGPDLDLAVRIEDTDMRRLNRMWNAYGNFDVSAGEFSLYSELHVRNGNVTGYVKPLFRDMRVADSAQDRPKGLFHKIYEGFVGLVAKLLENRQRDEVATVAELHGPIGKPRSSTLQVIGGLVQNAFFKAILPGLQRNYELQTKSPRPG
ncbi:MAG TPA: DUF748 domain-containing protein [Thermoanaerobaculia bacterium]|jgi:hypothetical protein